MNSCITLGQTQSFQLSGPSHFSSKFSPSPNCCTDILVESLNAIAGKVDVWCSIFDQSPAATLHQENEHTYCKPTPHSISLNQYGWNDYASKSNIKVKLSVTPINCSDVPPSSTPYQTEELFEFGLPAGQTGHLSPKRFEMSTLRRSFKRIGLNHYCQKLTLIHKGEEANYASAYCATSYYNGDKPGTFKGFVLMKKGSSFVCAPVQKGNRTFPSHLEISYNPYFWLHLLNSNNTGTDASLKLRLNSYPCDEKENRLTTSSAFQNSPSLSLLVLTSVFSLFMLSIN